MRLIDADEVVTIQVYDDMTEKYGTKKVTIADAIDEWSDEGCPETIDAELVRYSIWDAVDEDEFHYRCFSCGYNAYGNTTEVMDGTFRYCPHCGARMEAVE